MTALAPFSLPGKFRRGNLHTHSTNSDGEHSPQKVVNAYKDAGYDFLLLSEHYIPDFDWPITDSRDLRDETFTTLIGAELHAPATSAGEYWHIIAAGLPLDFAPTSLGETGAQLARRAADAGAFIAIAHPAWGQLTLEDGLSVDAAHAVEIYNHGCETENSRGYGLYLHDQLLNVGKRLTSIAVDDAHFRHADYDAFGGWVYVKTENLDPDEILQSLKAGHYYSSQGPQIHSAVLKNNTLEVTCSPASIITVVGGISKTATEIGHNMTSAVLDLSNLQDTWLDSKPSPWLRLVIIDEAGKKAWSNPIWLDEL